MKPGAIAIALGLAAACAGGGSGGGGGGGGTGGGGGGGGGSAADCERARAHVIDLYAAEAKPAKDPKVGEQLVADGTRMVMAECTRVPGRVALCAAKAATAQELEATCLEPLDEEGTDGLRFVPR